MKLYRVLALPVAALFVQFVPAQFALAQDVAPDPRVLATTESILAYCGRLDPSAAGSFQGRIQMITQGASDETLEKIRKSEQYAQARESTDASLAQVAEHDAANVCAQFLAQGQ